MKKLFGILSAFVFAVAGLFGTANAATMVNSSVKSSWGNPSQVVQAWKRAELTSAYIKPKKTAANASDEAIVVVYMARSLVEHGGYFCATQLRSRNEGASKATHVWTQYQEVGDNNCMWLCEPNYNGENCAVGTGASCDKTVMSKATLSAAGYEESGGYDNNTVESALANGGMTFFVWGGGTKTDESDTFVMAVDWLANGHGIKARPVTFAAHCGTVPKGEECNRGNSNLTVAASNGNEKTLCLPGWSGPGCTASIAECKACPSGTNTVWSDKDQKCVCGAGAASVGGGCIMCDNAKDEYLSKSQGKCIACPKAQYWSDNSDKCVDKTKYSMTQLAKPECLDKFDNAEYRDCLDGKVPPKPTLPSGGGQTDYKPFDPVALPVIEKKPVSPGNDSVNNNLNIDSNLRINPNKNYYLQQENLSPAYY